MSVEYVKTNWKNAPDTSTPITAIRLNKIEQGIYDCAEAVNEHEESKQDKLVSTVNIKTINNQSILGSGNLVVQGGGGGAVSSVNGQTGDVVLDAEDVGAVSDSVIGFDAGIVKIIGSNIKIGGANDAPFIANVGYTGNFAMNPNNDTSQLTTKEYVDGKLESKTDKANLVYETWTFTLDDDTTVSKEVVLWTSQE